MIWERIKNNKNNKIEYWCVAIAVCVLYAIFLSCFQIYPFGNRIIEDEDFVQQNLPLYYHFWDALHGKSSFIFSWKVGMGSGLLGADACFSLFSPFTLLLLFTTRAYLPKFMTWLILVKLVAMGETMVYCLRSTARCKQDIPFIHKTWIISIALGYAVSGYNIQYFGFAWMDVAVMVPLIFAMLHKLIYSEAGVKCQLAYVFLVAWIILMYIPQAYTVCIFIIIYVSLAFIIQRKQINQCGKRLFRITYLSCCSLGLSAFFFLPAVFQINKSYRATLNSHNLSWQSYLEKISASGMEFGRKYMMAYSMSITIVCILTLLVIGCWKKQLNRQHVVLVILSILMFLPIPFEKVNLVWHNGAYVCFPMRYGFLFVFICLYTLYSLLEVIPANKATVAIAYTVLWLSLVVVIGIQWCGKRVYSVEPKGELSLQSVAKEVILTENSPFQRIKNTDHSLRYNYPLVIGCSAVSNYVPTNTAEQVVLNRFLGYSQDWVKLSDNGGTAFSDALLQMNQLIKRENSLQNWQVNHTDSSLYQVSNTIDGYTLYESINQYPELMWVSNESVQTAAQNVADNPFYNLNELSRVFFNRDFYETWQEPLDGITEKGLKYEIDITGRKGIYIFFKNTGSVEIRVNKQVVQLPTYADEENTLYPTDYVHGVVCLGYYQDELVEVEIVPKGDAEVTGLTYFGVEDLDAFIESTKDVGGSNIESLKIGEKTVELKAKVEQDGYIYLPMYADTAWRCKVNGEQERIYRLENALCLVPVHKGDNIIKMHYFPVWQKQGIIITFIATILLFLYLFFEKKYTVTMEKISGFLGAILYPILVIVFIGIAFMFYCYPIYASLNI